MKVINTNNNNNIPSHEIECGCHSLFLFLLSTTTLVFSQEPSRLKDQKRAERKHMRSLPCLLAWNFLQMTIQGYTMSIGSTNSTPRAAKEAKALGVVDSRRREWEFGTMEGKGNVKRNFCAQAPKIQMDEEMCHVNLHP
jgi:hypothetical protein